MKPPRRFSVLWSRLRDLESKFNKYHFDITCWEKKKKSSEQLMLKHPVKVLDRDVVCVELGQR